MLEDESIEIAADNEEPGILGLQTADQVIARPRSCAGDENPLAHALSCCGLGPDPYAQFECGRMVGSLCLQVNGELYLLCDRGPYGTCLPMPAPPALA